MILLAPNGPASAVTVTTLATFNGTNGALPEASLLLASNGWFYGTTRAGGIFGNGTVFAITPSNQVINLVSFDGTNGAQPVASLIQGNDGKFYGTTSAGGPFGFGTVFSLTVSNTLTTIASFSSNNGAAPFGGVVAVPPSDTNFNLSLYGTTSAGGAFGLGTIFTLGVPGGSLVTLTSFAGTNGAKPSGGLTVARGSNNLFYGTTSGGGQFNQGTIFSFRPGATNIGTTLFSFHGTNGVGPQAGLFLGSDGNYYGTTAGGGAYGQGTVFQFNPNGGALTNLASLDGTNGGMPFAAVAQGSDMKLYGTALSGGAFGFGTVFSVSLNGGFSNVYSFPRGKNGAEPLAGLTPGTNGNLYGVTSAGGPRNQGTFYQLSGFPPVLLARPSNLTLPRGATAVFTGSATGSLPLKYQWRYNSITLRDLGRFSGTMTPTLTISNVTTADNGTYTLVVQNSAGIVSNATATLTVVNPPTPPNIRITSPSPNSLLRNPVLFARGTSSDALGVAQVYVQLNGGGWELATPERGWSPWTTTPLMLQPGTNILEAFAVNLAGLFSPTNRVSFILSPGKSALAVQTNGSGSVSPVYSTNQLLDVFGTYAIKSLPARNYVLASWVGMVGDQMIFSNDSPATTFVMQSNLVLQANFVPSPFPNAAYHAIFLNTNNPAPSNSGSLDLALTTSGAFSGSLLQGATRYAMSGRFHLNGSAQTIASHAQKTPLAVALQLNLTTNSTDQLGGTVTHPAWIADVVGDRAAFDGVTKIAGGNGQYTMILPGAVASGVSPAD